MNNSIQLTYFVGFVDLAVAAPVIREAQKYPAVSETLYFIGNDGPDPFLVDT